jgi:ABC-type multidrug transport system ATPase subunit
MAQAALVLDAVRKRFRRRGPWVLDGVDLTCEPGSTTVVLGPNGSGKSTLLRVSAGLCDPNAGRSERPCGIGYVPERQPARIRMTGLEYLRHMGAIRGLDRSRVEERSRALLDLLDLRPGPDMFWESLSKGNRQKLMLAQALLAPVPLLVMDEPFSALDVRGHEALAALLDEARESGSAVLMSSHARQRAGNGVRTFQIEGGRLQVHEPGPSAHGTATRMHVVVAAKSGSADPAVIQRLPGVVAGSYQPERRILTLEVSDADTDEVIAAAIDSRWSVLLVEPTAHWDDEGSE